jgi:transposase
LACYGLLARWADPRPDHPEGQAEQMWLRFVQERPVSAVTTQFLAWCCERLTAAGKTALVLVWDNASWHISVQVRTWIRDHNRRVRQEGRGVRIVLCRLPVKSPWLNPIEPKWVHGKRKVVEPARLLTAAELEERVCAYYDCAQFDHLAIPQKVA